MADTDDIPFPLTLRELETKSLGEGGEGEGVSNLKFFHVIDIYKMVVIFQFFHNGQR